MKHTNKITRSARGEDCQVRIGGYCNRNNETTIFAHKNGGGMGYKSSAIHGAYCCSDCHDAVDGRTRTHYSTDTLKMFFYEGIFRTQIILVNKKLIELKL